MYAIRSYYEQRAKKAVRKDPWLSAPAGDPCVMVIFGASGDLTQRMLLPALFRLYLNGGLPEP